MFRHLHPSASSAKSIGLFSPSLLLRATGTVKQWNSKGNFGLIVDDETEKLLLVSAGELLFADPLEVRRFLVPLQRVRYERVPRNVGNSNNNSNNNKNSVETEAKRSSNFKKQSSALAVDEMCVRVRDISGKALLSPLLMNGVSRSNQQLFNHHQEQQRPQSFMRK